MDFKEIGLKHLSEDYAEHGEFRPMVLIVNEGHYRLAFPYLNKLNCQDVVTGFGVMMKNERAYHCLFFLEGVVTWRSESGEFHPSKEPSKAILVHHFQLRPEPTRAEITCVEVKIVGKQVKTGESVSKDEETDPAVRWFWAGYQNPNYWMMKVEAE